MTPLENITGKVSENERNLYLFLLLLLLPRLSFETDSQIGHLINFLSGISQRRNMCHLPKRSIFGFGKVFDSLVEQLKQSNDLSI